MGNFRLLDRGGEFEFGVAGVGVPETADRLLDGRECRMPLPSSFNNELLLSYVGEGLIMLPVAGGSQSTGVIRRLATEAEILSSL